MEYLRCCTKIIRAPLLITILFIGIGADWSRNSNWTIPDISERINRFSIDLLKHQAKSEKHPSNIILSPQSIYQGLAMSYIVSGGETRQELFQALNFPEDNEKLVDYLGNLIQQIRMADEHEKVDVSLANSLWLDGTHADFREEYINKVRDAFDAPVNIVQFSQSGRVSNEINNWVAKKTNGKIPACVSPDDFKSKSFRGVIDEPALVTVNAVYFKSDWASKFDKDKTRLRDFHTAPTTSTETMMMHQDSMLDYAEDERFKFLELPYLDDLFSMYVVLPKDILSISELMDELNMETIVKLKRQAYSHYVDVLLPKFEIKSHSGIKNVLEAMGVKAAFDNKSADFDKMINKKPEASRVYISQIYHDAWIDVHEEGTEAAAATTTIHFSIGCSAPEGPIPAQFHADHPFLFMIMHNESRSILFAGWISKPNNLQKK